MVVAEAEILTFYVGIEVLNQGIKCGNLRKSSGEKFAGWVNTVGIKSHPAIPKMNGSFPKKIFIAKNNGFGGR